MADVTIDPPGFVASVGNSVTFTAKLPGVELKDATYAWKRDGADVSGSGQALAISPVTSDDEGAYTVTITTSDKKTYTTAAPAVLAVKGDAPLEWDENFAGMTVGLGILLLLGIAWPLFWALGTAAHQRNFAHNYPTLIAVEFVLVGTLLVFATIVVALLELRGRSRKPKPVAPSRPLVGTEAETPPSPTSVGAALAAAAPATIEAWGHLKAVAALLLAALGLFAGGATLAWKSLGSGTTTTGPTSTQTTTTSTGSTTAATTTAP